MRSETRCRIIITALLNDAADEIVSNGTLYFNTLDGPALHAARTNEHVAVNVRSLALVAASTLCDRLLQSENFFAPAQLDVVGELMGKQIGSGILLMGIRKDPQLFKP